MAPELHESPGKVVKKNLKTVYKVVAGLLIPLTGTHFPGRLSGASMFTSSQL